MTTAVSTVRAWLERGLAPVTHSLSGRLFLLTIGFVLLSQALVYLPSVVTYHHDLLLSRLASAQLAVLPFVEQDNTQFSDDLRREMLANAGVLRVVLKRNEVKQLYLADEAHKTFDAKIDMRGATFWDDIAFAWQTFFAPDGRILQLIDVPRLQGGVFIEAWMVETPIKESLRAYAWRMFLISLLVSAIAGFIVYLLMSLVFVRPMKRISGNMLSFREQPEDARRIMLPSGRRDEIGQAEETLADMQRDLRSALHQRAHLAALGTAVAKINHDLRNILASAQLASDRLAASEDPVVQKLAPRLVGSIDRAIYLATNTLKYARAEDTAPQRQQVALKPLVADVVGSVTPDSNAPQTVSVETAIPDTLKIDADPEQLFRILSNILRNAVEILQVGDKPGRVEIVAERSNGAVWIDIADNGPGIPDKARARLFEPFSGSARAGGTGLGLAIAKELSVAHGGDIVLMRSGSDGTQFRIIIPDSEEDMPDHVVERRSVSEVRG
jgi:signal transduction histidine kinase